MVSPLPIGTVNVSSIHAAQNDKYLPLNIKNNSYTDLKENYLMKWTGKVHPFGVFISLFFLNNKFSSSPPPENIKSRLRLTAS